MQLQASNTRRGQTTPTAQQKEEWQRSGFDAALAQALFAHPFLEPTPAKTQPSAPPAGVEHAQSARARLEENARSLGSAPDPTTAPAATPSSPPETAGDPEPDVAELTAPTETKAPPVETQLADPPSAEVFVPDAMGTTSRGSEATSSAPRADAGGATAIVAATRGEGQASDEHSAPSNQTPPDASPTDHTSVEEKAKAAQFFRPVEVRFDAGDGQEGRLRVSVQGQSVRATILAPDEPLARQLERDMPEMRRALQERGFRKTEVRIRPPRTRAEAADSDADPRIVANPER